MKFDPAAKLQQSINQSACDGVNPAISDSATFSFSKAELMSETFEGKTEGCFLYSRHWNPTNMVLSSCMAAIEGTGAAWVTGSGMSAITSTILQICNSGDHIISSITTYGGTYAFLQNWLPKYNIETTFVDITDLKAVEQAVWPNTKMVYTETLTNPLLQLSDIPELSKITKKKGLKLVVDNTFTPMIFSPHLLGADIVVHSMTKFINGTNDCVAGVICSSDEFIDTLIDVHTGSAMLLGPVLDPLRSASIRKNLFTLHLRMKKHGENAMFLAKKMKEKGLKVKYPGLPGYLQQKTFRKMMNDGYGFGGMLTIDLETTEKAGKFMVELQKSGIGYLAVSLGYFRTLFCNSGTSTSSEVPLETQKEMGLSPGLVRMSVGLDQDIELTWEKINKCLKEI